ncbi:MAG: cyclodeaminase/cyclohydrolase family protein [Desulfosporosinus sp.]|jgi:formiminotetrahydrofolate cyclodeaminase
MDTNKVWEWTIEEFLTESAGSSPTPGGGSVSAYVGALAAAMICMVANLTLGKEKYQEVEPQVKEILVQADRILSLLKIGLNQDIAVFSDFMAVFKLPKGSEAEKRVRARKMQEALLSATDTPLGISQNCYQILQLAHKLAPIGNLGAISDVGVAAYLAESALKSALLSVDINLPQIKDEGYQSRVKAERSGLIKQASVLCAETIVVVQSRISGS